MKMIPKKSLTGVDGWMPTTEKSLPYELTCSVLLLPSAPGVPKWIKVQQQHAMMFAQDKCIDEQSGKLIAEWAHGAITGRSDKAAEGSSPSSVADVAVEPVTMISVDQTLHIRDLLTEHKINDVLLLRAVSAVVGSPVDDLSSIPAQHYQRAIDWINKKVDGKRVNV